MLGVTERFADYATKSVASDGVADDFGTDGQAEAGTGDGIAVNGYGKAVVSEAPSLAVGGFEVDLAKYPAFGREPQTGSLGKIPNQGISFLRPLARRRARILRPLAVAMRARKP